MVDSVDISGRECGKVLAAIATIATLATSATLAASATLRFRPAATAVPNGVEAGKEDAGGGEMVCGRREGAVKAATPLTNRD